MIHHCFNTGRYRKRDKSEDLPPYTIQKTPLEEETLKIVLDIYHTKLVCHCAMLICVSMYVYI